MAREPKIAYVMLRNAHFGPRLAASVELCVRDLVVHSRYARTTLVVCPPVDEPFEGVEIATIPDPGISGNLGKAWGVAKLLRRRGVDLAIVENHLPAAAFLALTSGARVILHTHAYVKAPTSALDGALRGQEMRRLSGFAFVSEYALSQFRADFPGAASRPSAPCPTGSTCKTGRRRNPRTDRSSASAARSGTRATSKRWRRSRAFCLRGPNGAPASWCPTRRPPTGSRRLVDALRAAAEPFNGRIRVDSNVPYAEVKAAWERAEVGMVLTTGPEPFGRTALEAMASGAALITSGRGGLAEICGPCAVTVEPSDADGIAAALGQLLDAPERRADLARRRTQARRGFVRYPNHRAADGRIHRGLPRRGAGTSPGVGSWKSSRAAAVANPIPAPPEFDLPLSRAGGKAASVTSTPTISRLEAPADDPPLIARGGARFWRVNFALFLGSFATFALLYCVQPLMPLFARAFSISPAAASLSLSAATGVLAVGDDLCRNAVGRLWTQGDHDSLAGRRRGGDACRLLFAELDDVCRASGADRPCALRRSGGRDGLSGRRDGSFGDRARDGPLYRRQHAGRLGWAPGDRRVR